MAPASRPGWRRCPGLAPAGPVRRGAAAAAQGQGRAGDGGARVPRQPSRGRPARRLRRQRRGHPSGRGHAGAARRRGRNAGRARPRPGPCRAPSGRHDDAARDFVGMAFRCIARDRRRCALLGLLPRRVRRRPRRRGYGPPARGPAPASGRLPRARLRLQLGHRRRRGAGPRAWDRARSPRQRCRGLGGRPRERAGRAPQPRGWPRRHRGHVERDPLQSAAAFGLRRGPRTARKPHRRRTAAAAARRLPRYRRAAPHASRSAARCAFRERCRGCGERTLPRLARSSGGQTRQLRRDRRGGRVPRV